MSSISGGERDLERLLADLAPRLDPREWVFACVPEDPGGLAPFATVREAEGLTVVIARDEADARALGYEFVARRITLEVHSALEAVGMTAAVSARLADAGISCNMIAGAFHDHLFVPADRAEEALRRLGG